MSLLLLDMWGLKGKQRWKRGNNIVVICWESGVREKTKLLVRNHALKPPEIKAPFAVTYISCTTGGGGAQISLHWSYLSSTVVFLSL